MPRKARELSPTGMYHIYAVGERLKKLTVDIADKEELCAILKAAKENYSFDLFAYSVTENELHLVVKEYVPLGISEIMKFILSTYTSYYNVKYKKNGALIHDRFVSNPILSGEDLKKKIRYVHQLPVIYKEWNNVYTYKFSSYNDYFNDNPYVAVSEALQVFGIGAAAKTQYKIYHAMAELNDYKKPSRVRYSHEELTEILFRYTEKTEEEVKKLPQEEKLKAARILRKKTDISLRQAEEVCHVSRSMIDEKEKI